MILRLAQGPPPFSPASPAQILREALSISTRISSAGQSLSQWTNALDSDLWSGNQSMLPPSLEAPYTPPAVPRLPQGWVPDNQAFPQVDFKLPNLTQDQHPSRLRAIGVEKPQNSEPHPFASVCLPPWTLSKPEE